MSALRSLALFSLPTLLALAACDLFGGGDDGDAGCDEAACQEECQANGQEGSCVDGACACRDPDPVDQRVPPGSACSCDSDCQGDETHPGVCIYGVCMQRAAASCSAAGSSAECLPGSRCWQTDAGWGLCWPDCAEGVTCVGQCDSDNSCAPTDQTNCDPACGTLCRGGTQEGAVGTACTGDADCGGDAVCYTNWLDGYCMIFDCTSGTCPAGSACVDYGENVCLQSCTRDSNCRDGYYCFYYYENCEPGCSDTTGCPSGMTCQGGSCAEPTCTEGSCPANQACVEGRCLTVGPEPGQNTAFPLDQLATLCPDLPPVECDLGRTECSALVPFEPTNGPGYYVQRIYDTYVRRDLMMLIKHATAYVDCLAANWEYGNGGPLGLGDMSDANGDIPGAAENDPRHPDGTHTNGFDADVGYYQVNTTNNDLRPICNSTDYNYDYYHCIEPPNRLDAWRSALFLGALMQHPSLRVVGADGQAGQILYYARDRLCELGWLAGSSCSGYDLTFEMVDHGYGWFYSHHHHMHISLSTPSYSWSAAPAAGDRCLVPGCDRGAYDRFLERTVGPGLRAAERARPR